MPQLPLAPAFALALLVACSAAGMKEEEWQQRTGELASAPPSADESYPGARLMTGELVTGASVRYRLEREREDGGADTWDLVFSAPAGPFDFHGTMYCTLSGGVLGDDEAKLRVASPAFRGAFGVREGDGEYETSEAVYALGFTGVGLARACELIRGADEAAMRALAPELTASYGSLLAFATLCKENAEARALLFSLVQKPSLWKWLVPGVDITASADVEAAERVPTALGEGWRVPVEVTVKGDAALYAQVTLVAPRGVLQLTGGVVEVSAIAPHRPERPIRVHLVEAAGPADGRELGIRAGWSLAE